MKQRIPETFTSDHLSSRYRKYFWRTRKMKTSMPFQSQKNTKSAMITAPGISALSLYRGCVCLVLICSFLQVKCEQTTAATEEPVQTTSSSGKFLDILKRVARSEHTVSRAEMHSSRETTYSGDTCDKCRKSKDIIRVSKPGCRSMKVRIFTCKGMCASYEVRRATKLLFIFMDPK